MIEEPIENLKSPLLDDEVYGKKSNQQKETTYQLRTWKGFIRYESSFVALFFLELLWNRLDTLVASFLFTDAEIATQSAWMNLVMVIGNFSPLKIKIALDMDLV